jgi:large subunit ribosomal protein L18e
MDMENEIKKFLKKIKQKKKANVNVYKLEKLCNDSDNVIIYGKVLGDGEIAKKINVYALGFSKSAKEKIIKAGGNALKIKDLKSIPKGVKIIR